MTATEMISYKSMIKLKKISAAEDGDQIKY